MSGRVKKAGYRGGRGYCGWHTTFDGDSVYLRSTNEFVFATLLDRDQIYYKTECAVFVKDSRSYKPDFFIYSDKEKTKLIRIVEVKYTKKESDQFRSDWFEYFSSIGIQYECVYEFRKLKKDPSIRSRIDEWIERYVSEYSKFDYRGQKNPMFGVKHSKETKDKIGRSTTNRFAQDNGFREKHSRSRKEYWNTEEGMLMKSEFAKMRSLERDVKNPIVSVSCSFCGKIYEKRMKDRYHKDTCSLSCAQKKLKLDGVVYHPNGKLSFQRKMIRCISKFTDRIDMTKLYEEIDRLKKSGHIPRNLGLSRKTVEKYFTTTDNFIQEIRIWQESNQLK